MAKFIPFDHVGGDRVFINPEFVAAVKHLPPESGDVVHTMIILSGGTELRIACDHLTVLGKLETGA